MRAKTTTVRRMAPRLVAASEPEVSPGEIEPCHGDRERKDEVHDLGDLGAELDWPARHLHRLAPRRDQLEVDRAASLHGGDDLEDGVRSFGNGPRPAREGVERNRREPRRLATARTSSRSRPASVKSASHVGGACEGEPSCSCRGTARKLRSRPRVSSVTVTIPETFIAGSSPRTSPRKSRGTSGRGLCRYRKEAGVHHDEESCRAQPGGSWLRERHEERRSPGRSSPPSRREGPSSRAVRDLARAVRRGRRADFRERREPEVRRAAREDEDRAEEDDDAPRSAAARPSRAPLRRPRPRPSRARASRRRRGRRREGRRREARRRPGRRTTGRARGSFSRQRRITRSTAGSKPARTFEGAVGVSCSCFLRISASVGASNARLPVATS